MTGHRQLVQRIVLSLLAVGVGVALIVVIGVPGAMGAYTARVTNSTDAVSTNTWFTCNNAADGDNAFITYPLNEASYLSNLGAAADVSGGARNGSYTTTGVTYRAAGPCPRDSGYAVTLNGSSGYVSGPNTKYNLSTFSEEIWFKTTTGGGKLMGFGNQLTGASTQYDRHVYLTNTGNVVFGVYPTTVKVVTSPSTYLDGRWHHVVATQAPATNANPGIRLYVDGALVASDSTVVSNENVSEYWRIGYDNLASWGTTQPSNFYFTGSLAWASLYSTVALTPAQVKAHYVAGT